MCGPVCTTVDSGCSRNAAGIRSRLTSSQAASNDHLAGLKRRESPRPTRQRLSHCLGDAHGAVSDGPIRSAISFDSVCKHTSSSVKRHPRDCRCWCEAASTPAVTRIGVIQHCAHSWRRQPRSWPPARHEHRGCNAVSAPLSSLSHKPIHDRTLSRARARGGPLSTPVSIEDRTLTATRPFTRDTDARSR